MTHRVEIMRIIDAPRERVWRAWTEPEELAAWWGRRGWSTPPESVTLDVRPGGIFRLNSINDRDGTEMPMEAVYREVVEPERLVFARPGGRGASVTLTDLGDGRTEMVFRTELDAGADVRAAAAAGMGSAFDRLGELLARASTTVREQREEPL